VEVGCAFENLDNLEGGRLLSFNAVVIDRVNEVDGVVRSEVSSDVETVIKFPCNCKISALCATAWLNLPIEILPSGTRTAAVIPAWAA